MWTAGVIFYLAVCAYLCKKKGWQIHYLAWGAVGGLLLATIVPSLPAQTKTTMENTAQAVVSIFNSSGIGQG
ncbi:hypothetical protein KNU71_gp159 [Streptomyces phage Braelyn]|uniref:Uncharacterized protein n=1 Tax=Streptomyces phage Braelyn TaxID=2593356 RepID=A0A514U1Z4_9CAUD|nr:hypothetical protein KNU71_gp159 [Streptomyces phage Braelyn]QDK02960.1 hypothetical protein SEA_BRAELYN_110 [Streptomyces phage Braelyn]